MRDCVRACRRGLRQCTWTFLPSRSWRVAHETACVFHALQGSRADGRIRVPTLLASRCCACPCRASARFEADAAEEAFQEHVKETLAPLTMLWGLMWFVVIFFNVGIHEFVGIPHVDPGSLPLSFIELDSVRVVVVGLGILPLAARHWLSASQLHLFLTFLCAFESVTEGARLTLFAQTVNFVLSWGQYSVLTKLGPTFFTGLPFRHALVALVIDFASYTAGAFVHPHGSPWPLMTWNVVFFLFSTAFILLGDLQRRREFILKCEVSARRHTMEEVAGVYAFLAENTSDLLALHDLPRRDAAAAGAGTESALALASRVVEVRDSRPRFRYVSPASASSLGWEAEELMSADPFVLIHPEDRGRASLLYRSSPSPEASECEAWEQLIAERSQAASLHASTSSSSAGRRGLPTRSRIVTSLLSSLEEARSLPRESARTTPRAFALRYRLQRLLRLGLSAAAADADIVLPHDLLPAEGSLEASPSASLGIVARDLAAPADASLDASVIDAHEPASATVALHSREGDEEGGFEIPAALPTSAARIRVEPRGPHEVRSQWDSAARADLRAARRDLHRFLFDDEAGTRRAPAGVSASRDPAASEVVVLEFPVDGSQEEAAEPVVGDETRDASHADGPTAPSIGGPVAAMFRRARSSPLRGQTAANAAQPLRRYEDTREPPLLSVPTVLELRLRCSDGTYRRFQVSGNPTQLGLVCVYRLLSG